MTDWGQIVDMVVSFLEANPGFRKMERELWEWLLNKIDPPSVAHGRTMLASTGCLLEEFSYTYQPVLDVVSESEESDVETSEETSDDSE